MTTPRLFTNPALLAATIAVGTFCSGCSTMTTPAAAPKKVPGTPLDAELGDLEIFEDQRTARQLVGARTELDDEDLTSDVGRRRRGDN